MEHFKETEIHGFFVGSEGGIVNETGIKVFKWCDQTGDCYVGFQLDRGRRIMRKLSHLVYQFHVNRGRPLEKGYTVSHRDGDKTNLSYTNLTVRLKKNSGMVDMIHKPNKGRSSEVSISPIDVHPGWMLNGQ